MRNGRQHQRRIADAGKGHEPGAVGEGRRQLGCCLDGQARLADPTGACQREEPHVIPLQLCAELGHLALAPEEGRGMERQMVRRWGSMRTRHCIFAGRGEEGDAVLIAASEGVSKHSYGGRVWNYPNAMPARRGLEPSALGG